MKKDFTTYDIKPEGFINYLRYYGEHFNKKLFEFACEELDKCDYSKEEIDKMLEKHKIQIKKSKMYDFAYIVNWLKALSFGSGISDEQRLLLLAKDFYEKEGDLLFNRWYADCAKRGIPIEWEDII